MLVQPSTNTADCPKHYLIIPKDEAKEAANCVHLSQPRRVEARAVGKLVGDGDEETTNRFHRPMGQDVVGAVGLLRA